METAINESQDEEFVNKAGWLGVIPKIPTKIPLPIIKPSSGKRPRKTSVEAFFATVRSRETKKFKIYSFFDSVKIPATAIEISIMMHKNIKFEDILPKDREDLTYDHALQSSITTMVKEGLLVECEERLCKSAIPDSTKVLTYIKPPKLVEMEERKVTFEGKCVLIVPVGKDLKDYVSIVSPLYKFEDEYGNVYDEMIL